MSTIQVGIRLPKSLYDNLIEYANKNKLSKINVIILALANHLKNTESLSLEEKNPLENKIDNLKSVVHGLVKKTIH